MVLEEISSVLSQRWRFGALIVGNRRREEEEEEEEESRLTSRAFCTSFPVHSCRHSRTDSSLKRIAKGRSGWR